MSEAPSLPSLVKAVHLLEADELEDAGRMAETLLAGNDGDADVLHLLGVVRARQERPDEALVLLARAIAARPRQPPMLMNFGKVLAAMNQPEHAIAAFSDAVRFDPMLLEGWLQLGEQYRRLGRMDEAERHDRQALSLAPGHGGAALALGLLLLETGRPEEAEMVLIQSLTRQHEPPMTAALTGVLGDAQAARGRKEAALASYARAQTLDPRRTDLDGRRAMLLEDMHRFDEALAAMETILAREPENVSAHAAYNELLYRLGRDADFLSSYDRAPASVPLLHAKGTFLLAARRGAEAERLYTELLARVPDDREALSGLATALNLAGRHDEAQQRLEEALACQPGDPALLIGIATGALLGGDPQKAAAMAERGLERAPFDQYGLAVLGSAWRLMGDARDETLNDYDDLVRIYDLDPPDGFSDMADFNRELETYLTGLHPPTREFILQSLRGGTQTVRALFGAGHELVEALRRRIAEAVERHITELQPKADHPFRGRLGQGFAFAGSWSSRLSDRGYHVNHIHPGGWISSCYYVGVPDAAHDAGRKEGWLTFGEPAHPIGLGPRRTVQPVPGRLVLFPSYLWHGTIPFHDTRARTTIAFDAVPAVRP